ncbi:MAG: DUF835 domain-containing protein [Methanomassiliicoccus sp.]|nr:DUF835 domain-containing protein [Methanomassiliicoccus sp.]
MLEGALIPSLLAMFAAVICLSLGVFVLWKNPYLKISQVYVSSMCITAICMASLFLLFIARSDGQASIFGRVGLVTWIITFTSFMYLAMFLPYEAQGAWPARRKKVFILLSISLAVTAMLLPVEFTKGEFGYWWSPSVWMLVWAFLLVILCSIPVYYLTRFCAQLKDPKVDKYCTMVTVAVLLPLMVTFLDSFLYFTALSIPPLLPIAMAGSGVIFAYAVLSYEPFESAPLKPLHRPAGRPKAPPTKFDRGHCDLVKSKRADEAYRLFASEVQAGNRGLLITRVHPDQVRERYGKIEAQVMWLSGQPGQDRLDPASLTIIQNTMVDFLQKGPRSVILLDGIDHLISENQLDKVLRLVYAVHDAVVVSSSRFIVPIDPQTLEPKDLAFIEKEFVVLEEAET